MCGIFGYIGNRSSELPASAITSSIKHRGPDDDGFFRDEHVLLVHTRLSILDTSYRGHQPMTDISNNYTIIFNGEIYNHLEIRKNLIQKGYTFTSSSDTETLLYGYIEYGESVCTMLNGIFVFSIYSANEQTVFIARDHFGNKPLYYYEYGQDFAFASEIKSFLQIPFFDRSLNISAFPYYLQMLYAPGAITPFQYVHKLLPGNSITYNLTTRKYALKQYYQLAYHIDNTITTEKQWCEKVDFALDTAVQRQLLADVPVGCFLSGGLDSSLIAAYANRLYSGQLQAFTISSNQQFYKEGFDEDEVFAVKIAKQLGINLHHIQANFNIIDDFDKMIWHLDEPQADPAPLLVYKISEAAQAMGIKVLLSGTAGDDIFSGYRRHQALRLESLFRFMPSFAATTLHAVISPFEQDNASTRRLQKLITASGKKPYQRWASYFSWLPEQQVVALFNKEMLQGANNFQLPESYYTHLLSTLPSNTDNLNKLLYLEMKTFLPDHNLNYTDKMSMAAGVEVRVPYLDQDLVALLSTMPVRYKMKGSTTKYILKKVAEKYLDHDVIYRKKTGFGAPVRVWIKNEMKDMIAERLSSSRLKEIGFLDVSAVHQLIAANQAGKVDAAYSIWGLLAIESWLTQFYNK